MLKGPYDIRIGAQVHYCSFRIFSLASFSAALVSEYLDNLWITDQMTDLQTRYDIIRSAFPRPASR